ncbi:winged helix-turn-helix domain-containing protein [Streptomyces sp. NBC_00487]|uniref:BTAD domain-containing putative transcriptional regulator n=1 Tax=unclassified Streptomyces TaxID=2593676 RepID=UPI002E180879|nr:MULTISPECIES: BTAD domain-containing putative transcriptional regulator [unclassified Streptomyces]
MDTLYEFGILGPLAITRDGQRVSVGSAQLRTLLAALLVDAGHVVSVDALVGRLWGEHPPRGARNAVQNYVLRLRRALGPEVVRTERRGYALDARAKDRLDARRFSALVREGGVALAEDRPDQAVALLGDALGLWRGEPLADLAPERFPDVVPALCEQRLAAQELWIDALIRCRRHEEALPELRRLIALHPLRERFWAQRMLALYQCGRQCEALECFREISGLLAEELGVDPGTELQTLHQRMLTAAPDLAPAPPRTPGPRRGGRGNLPAETTSFIGRERELAETQLLLGLSRLVTLTGVGGVGKTRLALRAARRSAAAFPDGVWLVDLAALTDPALLERAVAEALGLRDQSTQAASDAVVGHLSERHLLIVLDNCEHMVDAVALLVLRLLRAAPELRVLATSRERLGVPGEHLLLVPCLTLQDGPDGTPCEAVRLLVDRAAACAATLSTGDRHGASAAELCRRLDGIPLAIELAAVRLSSLTVEEVLERLEDRFRLLSNSRSAAVLAYGPEPASAPPASRYLHTLRGVMDWSHSLCTHEERLLWARLSVFVGCFDLRAAEAVCAGEGIAREDVLDLVDGLVHKSVVTVEPVAPVGRRRSTTRYRLLETVRQYGMDRLRAEGNETGLLVMHSDYYRALAGRAAAEWCGPDEVGWLERLRRELPNLRSALGFCRVHPGRALTGAAIAVDLMRTRCWFFGSTLGEARHWLESLSVLLDPALGEPTVLTATMKAFIAILQGDRAAAGVFLEECRAAPVSSKTAPALYIEGVYALLVLGDPICVAQLSHAREEFIAAGQSGDAHMATMFWAMAAVFLGNHADARFACDTYVAEAEAAGAEWAHTWAQWCTALAELLHGEPSRGLPPLCDALVRQHAIDDNWGPAWSLETLAWTLGALGHHGQAAVVLGAAHRHRQVTGATITGLRPFATLHARTQGLVRKHMAAEAYSEAWERGATAEDSIATALGIAHEIDRQTVTATPPQRLADDQRDQRAEVTKV